MILAVDHIDLKVPDLESSVRFFLQLGMVEVRRTGGGRGSVEMALPGPKQVLFELREDTALHNTVIDHVAFAVDSTAGTINLLQNAGIQFGRTNHPVPSTGRIVSNFSDPHGGKWQLAE